MIEAPKFLLEMSKQLNEQGNRMTADPLFEVRYKTSLVTESGYNESHFEVFNEEGVALYHSERSENLNELAEFLIENEIEWCKAWCEENEIEMCGGAFVEYFNDLVDLDWFEWNELPGDLRALHMQEIEVTVNSHLTEAGAKAFIERKQHDYPKLYTYAISLSFCAQMIELRNWIKSLEQEK